jgi:hypothetical protein
MSINLNALGLSSRAEQAGTRFEIPPFLARFDAGWSLKYHTKVYYVGG